MPAVRPRSSTASNRPARRRASRRRRRRRRPTTGAPRRPTSPVWPARIVAPKATPEDSLIDSCSTDGDDGPEYRLLSLAGDEIGDHLRATANTSHLDLLKRVAAPVAPDDDDDDDDEFEGRPVELCRDEVPPPAAAAGRATAGADASSPDPFRYVDVIAAAAAVARTVSAVNSCDATGFPRRRRRPLAGAAPGGLVRAGASLPGRLPAQSRSSTLPPRSAAAAVVVGDSSSDAETLTPAASARSSLSGIAATSTLTKKRSLTLPVGGGGGAAGDGSAGRLADSPAVDARLSPDDSPVSRFCHLGAHALDVFYSPGDDDDDDDGDDAGVVSPLPAASTAASGAGTLWRPVACTAAVDRRRRPSDSPPLPRSPPIRRRPRLLASPPARPSAAPLVGAFEGFSDIEGASPSDEEDSIRPPPRLAAAVSPSVAAQASSTELRQSSRSCSKSAEITGSRSTWLTTPVDASCVHRDSHSPATDTVWPAETLRPRYAHESI